MRLAHAIGLHLHNDVPDLDSSLKEMCVRTWYSICYLESILCMITGRPSAIRDQETYIPIPQSGNRALSEGYIYEVYYSATAELTMRSIKVLRNLYSDFNTSHKKNWSEVQTSIKNLHSEMENWRLSLPDPLRFEFDMSRDQIYSLQVSLIPPCMSYIYSPQGSNMIY